MLCSGYLRREEGQGHDTGRRATGGAPTRERWGRGGAATRGGGRRPARRHRDKGLGRRRPLDRGGGRRGDEARAAGIQERARDRKKRRGSDESGRRGCPAQTAWSACAARIAREPTVGTARCLDGPTAAVAAGNLEFFSFSNVLSFAELVFCTKGTRTTAGDSLRGRLIIQVVAGC
jgi:hypothetical protein